MGKIEERDALLSFNREHMPLRPRRTFLDIFLYPIRAIKELQRRRQIRKEMFKNLYNN